MSKQAQNSQITVEGVVAHAKEISERGGRYKNSLSPTYDPYAQPYQPTEAAARMLCSRKKKQALEALPPNPTKEQWQAACDNAPAAAKAELDFRWDQWVESYKRELESTKERTQRHVGRQRRYNLDRSKERGRLTPGQRLDRAIAELSTVSSVPAAGLEKSVSGTAEHKMPVRLSDPAGKARHIANEAVRAVEFEVDQAQRRIVEREAQAA